MQLRDAGRIAPIHTGVDFLGYRVRATHLICRPRVVGHCHETLDAWRRRWVRSDSACTVIDLPAAARETLAARVASYAAHFQHAAHDRLWQRLRARHALLRCLFQPPREGRCQPCWQPPRHLDRLPAQWRWFHQQCPQWFGWPPGTQAQAFRPWILWLQVGRMLETYGDHAQRIHAHWPRHGGEPVWRRGLGTGLAWSQRRRPALLARAGRWGWHTAWVAEVGVLPHGGRRRALRRLVLIHDLPLFVQQATDLRTRSSLTPSPLPPASAGSSARDF